MTNLESMRRMTAEQLADFIVTSNSCYEDKKRCTKACSCTECLIEWLKQEEKRIPTYAERELGTLTGAKYLTRDMDSPFVRLWNEKPEFVGDSYYAEVKGICLGSINADIFPKVIPGACICLEV